MNVLVLRPEHPAPHANQYADNVIQLPPLSMFARGDCQHKDESGNQSGVYHTIPIQPPPPQHHHLSCITIGVSVSMLFLHPIWSVNAGVTVLNCLVCCLLRTLLHCKHPATSFCLHLIIETATLSRLTLHQNWWEEQPLHTMDWFFWLKVCLQCWLFLYLVSWVLKFLHALFCISVLFFMSSCV